MNLFIKISLLLLLPVFVQAQQLHKQSHSLRMALGNAANDTIRLDVYDQPAYNSIELAGNISIDYVMRIS